MHPLPSSCSPCRRISRIPEGSWSIQRGEREREGVGTRPLNIYTTNQSLCARFRFISYSLPRGSTHQQQRLPDFVASVEACDTAGARLACGKAYSRVEKHTENEGSVVSDQICMVSRFCCGSLKISTIVSLRAETWQTKLVLQRSNGSAREQLGCVAGWWSVLGCSLRTVRTGFTFKMSMRLLCE